ncbi:hypothetical protein IWW50_002021 [Coemansia erecta]|nr:hypothetical protein GGF43_001615 [Coemansia sp. RSA 2618]KAJ2827159.1 hypothetical protein IWW50_002021 [Coemansia erecta]
MSSSRFPLLQREEERSVEVTWKDQQKINQFSKLNIRVENLEEDYKKQKEEKEYLDDLAMEIELVDEDEPIFYKVGDAFIQLPLDKAQARVEKAKEDIEEHIEKLDSQISAIQSEMDELKKTLYGKFGQAINLEKS